MNETCRIGNHTYYSNRTYSNGKVKITIYKLGVPLPLTELKLNLNQVKSDYKNLTYWLTKNSTILGALD